jgi:hypothetical protein
MRLNRNSQILILMLEVIIDGKVVDILFNFQFLKLKKIMKIGLLMKKKKEERLMLKRKAINLKRKKR